MLGRLVALLPLTLFMAVSVLADEIYFEGFEGRPSYSVQLKTVGGYTVGTQAPGTTSVRAFVGTKAFGTGNVWYPNGNTVNEAPATNVQITLKVRLSQLTQGSVVSWWRLDAVERPHMVSVYADQVLVWSEVSTYDATKVGQLTNSREWRQQSVALPDGAQDVWLRLENLTNDPQKYDVSLGNFYIDNLRVTATVVDGGSPGDASSSDPYTQAEVSALVLTACGDAAQCPEKDAHLACVMTELNDLKAIGKVTNNDYDMVLAQVENTLRYCDGYKQCVVDLDVEGAKAASYQQGHEVGVAEGVASVDVVAIESAAYNQGVASVDVVGAERLAYDNGYVAGRDSIDVVAIEAAAKDAGYTEGYDKGYQAGVSSVDVAAIRAQAYEEGYNAGESSIDIEAETAASYDKGYAEGLAAAPKCGKTQLKLILSAMPCRKSGMKVWRIKNPNNSDISARYELVGSNQTGVVMVKANAETFIETKSIRGLDTLRLYVGKDLQAEKTNLMCFFDMFGHFMGRRH